VVGMVFCVFVRAGLDMETKYYAIKVSDVYEHSDDVEVPKYKTLALDLLVHSYVKPWDPTWLGYEHEQIQCEITRYYRSQGRTGVLVIGGGGGTLHRGGEAALPALAGGGVANAPR